MAPSPVHLDMNKKNCLQWPKLSFIEARNNLGIRITNEILGVKQLRKGLICDPPVPSPDLSVIDV